MPYAMPPMPYGAGPMPHYANMMHGAPLGPMGFGRGHLLPTPVPHARVRRGTKRDASESVASASDAGERQHGGGPQGQNGGTDGSADTTSGQAAASDIDMNEQHSDGMPIVSANDKLLFKRYRELLPTPLEAQVMESSVRDLELALRHVSDMLAEQDLREKYPELQAEFDDAEKLFEKQKTEKTADKPAVGAAGPTNATVTNSKEVDVNGTATSSVAAGGDAEMADANNQPEKKSVEGSANAAATDKPADVLIAADAAADGVTGGMKKPRPFHTMRGLRKRRLDYLRQISGVARMGAYQVSCANRTVQLVN